MKEEEEWKVDKVGDVRKTKKNADKAVYISVSQDNKIL